MICPGDCVIDSSGCVGIAIDIQMDGTCMFKSVCNDGMELVYHNDMVTLASESFKKAYLKEMRRIKYAAQERDESEGNKPEHIGNGSFRAPA